MNIAHLELAAADLDSLQTFYEGTLGLPLTGTATDKRTFGIGATQLTFARPTHEPNGSYHFAFNIPENQFDEARTWLIARTPLLLDAQGRDTIDFPAWNAHSLYFKDPANNILEFIARHDLPNGSTAAFGPHGFLCVSEIGLTTYDVQKTAALLKRELGIDSYKGEGSDTFAAVGDEHGLFIVTKAGRIWMPDSGIPATLMPFRLTLSNGVSVESSRFAFGDPT
jgi:catechol-2,3-dioxygenase